MGPEFHILWCFRLSQRGRTSTQHLVVSLGRVRLRRPHEIAKIGVSGRFVVPTLEKRIGDGGFYIRHFFRDHHTWQIVGEGVRILAYRGVAAGERFSTDLFMTLWRQRLVYHGNQNQTGSRLASVDARVKTDLERRITEFYRLVQMGDLDGAWKIVATSTVPEIADCESPERTFERFVGDMRRLNLARWRHIDTKVHDFELEVGRENQASWRATRLGCALVRLWLGSGSDCIEREGPQDWLYSQGQWWLVVDVPWLRAMSQAMMRADTRAARSF